MCGSSIKKKHCGWPHRRPTNTEMVTQRMQQFFTIIVSNLCYNHNLWCSSVGAKSAQRCFQQNLFTMFNIVSWQVSMLRFSNKDETQRTTKVVKLYLRLWIKLLVEKMSGRSPGHYECWSVQHLQRRWLTNRQTTVIPIPSATLLEWLKCLHMLA